MASARAGDTQTAAAGRRRAEGILLVGDATRAAEHPWASCSASCPCRTSLMSAGQRHVKPGQKNGRLANRLNDRIPCQLLALRFGELLLPSRGRGFCHRAGGCRRNRWLYRDLMVRHIVDLLGSWTAYRPTRTLATVRLMFLEDAKHRSADGSVRSGADEPAGSLAGTMGSIWPVLRCCVYARTHLLFHCSFPDITREDNNDAAKCFNVFTVCP